MNPSELLHPAVVTSLDRLGCSFRVVACDESLADTAAFCEHYGYDLAQSANTIIVVGKTGERRYAACLLLATDRLDVNRVVRKRLGARRISFAAAEDTMTLTGMELGGVTPLALPDSLPLWIDSAVLKLDEIILGGGNRTSKLFLAPPALTGLVNSEVVEGLARPKAPPEHVAS